MNWVFTTNENIRNALKVDLESSSLYKDAFVVTMNGRIDNREELAAALKISNLSLNEISDSVYVLSAYQKWNDQAPEHLHGDFSFVIIDKSSGQFFCARDPLGIKALYYTKYNDEYYFSSDIDTLLNTSGLSIKPNLQSMRTMLYERAVDYHQTMYEGVYRLPPGYYMKGTKDKIEIKRYWFPENIEINYGITEDFAVNKLKSILTKAIEKRVSDLDKTAFELSGGLDSSSIVTLFSKKHNEYTIDTYSMKFNGLDCDESDYVESILSTHSLHHQYIPTEKLDYKKKYSLEYLYRMSPNWPITLTFALSLPMLEKMKQDGKEIIITGQGGDHIWTGSPYLLYDLVKRFKFLTLYRELRIYTKRWNMIKAYIVKPLLGIRVTDVVMHLLGKEKKDIFSNTKTTIKDLTEETEVKDLAFKIELDMITSAMHSTIMDGNLFHCAETNFDLEFRHPYFDRELVEFALSLPLEMKYKKGTIKWILRKAMNGILPDMIKNRKDKAEFSELILQQIDTIDLNMLLTDPYIVKLGLIEQNRVDQYRKEYRNKPIEDIFSLWIISNMEYWYRYNFERDSLNQLV